MKTLLDDALALLANSDMSHLVMWQDAKANVVERALTQGLIQISGPPGAYARIREINEP